MKKEYTVSILVEPEMATKHGILHESEAVEKQIKVAIEQALKGDFLYKNMGIEVLTVYPTKAVRYRRTKAEIELDKSTEKFRKEHPIQWPEKQSKVNNMNWDDDLK